MLKTSSSSLNRPKSPGAPAKLIPLPAQCRQGRKQAHARLIPCNTPIVWVADFFNTIRSEADIGSAKHSFRRRSKVYATFGK